LSGSSYLTQIERRLKPGDHLCSFYENKTEQFQVVLPFLKRGLDLGEKCAYIADENTVAEIKAGLLAHGVDVGRRLESGQLTVVTAREFYLRLGRFDPRAMMSFVISAVNEAVREGYPGLRVAGESTWILKDLNSLDDFLEYETMGNAALRNLPVKALCQYNVNRFLGSIIMKVLQTHSRVLLGLDLYENPFCEPLPAR